MMLSRDVPTEAAWPGDPVSKAWVGGRSESVPESLPPPAAASGCRGPVDSYPCPQGCYLAPEPATSFLAFPLSVVRNSFGARTLCLRERESPCLSQGHLLEETLLPQSKRERPRPLCSGKNLLVLSPLPSGSSTGEVPMPPPWRAPHCADPRGNLARQVSPHFADGETEAWVL